MNILFATPPGDVLKSGTRWSHVLERRGVGYYPFPFWTGYALAVLRDAGHTVAFIDGVALGLSHREFLARVDACAPDVIVWETSATSYRDDLELAKKIDVKKVVVGMYATESPEETVKDYDFVCVGEYEYALRDLASHLEGETKTFPKGIATKDRPRPERYPPIDDLDALPWPARDLMPMQRYNEPVARGRNVVLLASRGCPYSCSFCQVSFFYWGPSYRSRRPEKVVDEMEYLWRTYHPDELCFDDDTFNVNDKDVEALCDELLARKLSLSWGCMGTADISEKLLQKMAESGCTFYKFGVEHIDPDVLKAIGKPITKQKVIDVVAHGKDAGIRMHPTFLIGLPQSTKEKDEALIDFALHLKPETLQFAIATPYPRTKFYEDAIRDGWMQESADSAMGATHASVSYPQYPKEAIEETYTLAWRRWRKHILFRQPSTIFHHLYGVYRREGIMRSICAAYEGLTDAITK